MNNKHMSVAEYAAQHDLNEQVLRTRLRDLTKLRSFRESMTNKKTIDLEIKTLTDWLGESYVDHSLVGKSYVIFVK